MSVMSTSDAQNKMDRLEDAKQVFTPNGFGVVIETDSCDGLVRVTPIREGAHTRLHSPDEIEIVDDEECINYHESGLGDSHR